MMFNIKRAKRTVVVVLIAVVAVAIAMWAIARVSSRTSSGNTSRDNTSKNASLAIAYLDGIGYAAVIIARDQKLIEKYYREATGSEVKIAWNMVQSGTVINTSFMSGDLDVGFLGVAPVAIGIANNIGYKVFTGISGQEYGLMSNNPDLASVADFVGTDHQIATNSLNAMGHFVLAKALVGAGYGAHDLDKNLIGMDHLAGLSSLETGGISAHMVTTPYLYMERESDGLYEVRGISAVWSNKNSLAVGVASVKLYEGNPELYSALCRAIEEATELINSDVEAAAAISHEYTGNALEDEITYLKAGNYTTRTSGLYETAELMAKWGFIDRAPESYEAMVFDNVVGD